MPKKVKEPRTLTCQRTGKQFVYAGVGRPPKYCPEVQEDVRKEQRKAAQKAKRDASKRTRAAAIADQAPAL